MSGNKALTLKTIDSLWEVPGPSAHCHVGSVVIQSAKTSNTDKEEEHKGSARKT